jgi:hypothetical protein
MDRSFLMLMGVGLMLLAWALHTEELLPFIGPIDDQ